MSAILRYDRFDNKDTGFVLDGRYLGRIYQRCSSITEALAMAQSLMRNREERIDNVQVHGESTCSIG